MTDFNTWNESLIEAVRKSSLFENEGVEAGSSLCSRCLEIIVELNNVLPTLNEKEQRLTKFVIGAIESGRHQELDLGEAFIWDDTVQGGDWWADQLSFLEECFQNHNCIRDGHDDK